VPCRIIRRGNYTPEHRANFRLRSRSGFQPLSLGTKRQGCRFYYPARLSPQTKFQVSSASGGVLCRIIRRGSYTPEHRTNFRLRSRSGFQPLSLGTKRQGCRFQYPARLSPQTKFKASKSAVSCGTPGCRFAIDLRRFFALDLRDFCVRCANHPSTPD